jgi:hypothetical protein
VFLGSVVEAQSTRHYADFHVEFDRNGKPVALVFREHSHVGCSEIARANGRIAKVERDIVVTRFTVKLKSGSKSFFLPDSLNQISNIDRRAKGEEK